MYKTCVVCGKEFNDEQRGSTCCSTECVRARDLEHAREYSRKWRAKRPEHAREYNRRYRARNPERVHKQEQGYRAKNPERVRESSRIYAATSRGRAAQAAVSHNRRTRLSGILMTTDTVLELKSEYSGFCPYCGSKIIRGHVDHIIPVSRGGTNDRTNLAWVCKSCNSLKGNKSLLTFMLQRKEERCRTQSSI